jgi:hypothetical protein
VLHPRDGRLEGFAFDAAIRLDIEGRFFAVHLSSKLVSSARSWDCRRVDWRYTLVRADFWSLTLMLTNAAARRCLSESFKSVYEMEDMVGCEEWILVS